VPAPVTLAISILRTVPLNFERLIVQRYLRQAQGREEGRRFVRFITYVAIGGVTIGVAALLLALSIVRGFSEEIQTKIIGFGAHVQIESLQAVPIANAASVRDRVASWPEVARVDPVIQDFALLRRSREEIDGVMLWGVETTPEIIADNLIDGSPELGITDGMEGVLIGEDLARLLNVSVGDVVTSFSRTRDTPAGQAFSPAVRQFRISGIYQTHLQNFDELYVILDIEVARDFLDFGSDRVTRLDITLHDLETANLVVQRIEEQIGFPLMARTIFEVFRGLFAWVDLQENIIPVVISVIILVAAFNIIAILMMLILEKTREIGVMISLGATRKSIRRIFVFLGVAIGVIGTFLGSITALVFALLQERYSIIPLPAEAYYLDRAPIQINAPDFLLVGGITMLLCLLAAYIPARIAARIEPIRAIRL
jgi:lipoprotein-releasing system permease protein